MCEGAIFPAARGMPNPWGGTNIPREFGMGLPNSRGCQIPYEPGFDSIAQCIIALQDGGLATVVTEMALLITSAQTLYTLK